MKIKITTQGFSVIVDLAETTLEEYVVCLDEQYPVTLFDISKHK